MTEIEMIVKLLDKKFDISSIRTISGDIMEGNNSRKTGKLEIRVNESYIRQLFGTITVEYELTYIHEKLSRSYYSISSEKQDIMPVCCGCFAEGDNFEQVVNCFLQESEQFLYKKISRIQQLKSKLSEIHPGVYRKDMATFGIN